MNDEFLFALLLGVIAFALLFISWVMFALPECMATGQSFIACLLNE